MYIIQIFFLVVPVGLDMVLYEKVLVVEVIAHLTHEITQNFQYLRSFQVLTSLQMTMSVFQQRRELVGFVYGLSQRLFETFIQLVHFLKFFVHMFFKGIDLSVYCEMTHIDSVSSIQALDDLTSLRCSGFTSLLAQLEGLPLGYFQKLLHDDVRADLRDS